MLTILTQTQWSDLQQISYNKNINLLLINFAFLQTQKQPTATGKKTFVDGDFVSFSFKLGNQQNITIYLSIIRPVNLKGLEKLCVHFYLN